MANPASRVATPDAATGPLKRIAFLGLGAMGSRMTQRLLEAGHQVTVWNRTHEAAAALVPSGAALAATPAEAARRTDVVLAMVRDDEASRSVWLDPEAGALAALPQSAIAVDCSTLSVPHVRDLAATFAAKDRAFLEAPLAGSRPQAESGQLIFFAGGDADHLQSVMPLLETLGGAVHHAGDAGAGATVKLMVNALFGSQLASLAELITFAEKNGMDPTTAVEILAATPVCGPAAKLAANAMLAGSFAPAFPIELVDKDFDLIGASAAKAQAPIPMSAASGAVYKQAVAAGLGSLNITGIVQLHRDASPSEQRRSIRQSRRSAH